MKPAFALDLDNDAVKLLSRSDIGWLEVGRVDLDAGDLDAEMAALRARAAALAPEGWVTKLILPQSQILYTELEAPSNNRASQRADIVNALKGRTPYPVSELVFDWSRTGSLARVAVVARITLDEAEAFAEAHSFNPVAFVAVPPAGKFSGEPFFGTTAQASAHLPPGARLDRDQDPVRVVGTVPLPGPGTDAPDAAEAAVIDESPAAAAAPAGREAPAAAALDPVVVAEAVAEVDAASQEDAASAAPADEAAPEAPRSADTDAPAPLAPDTAPEPDLDADEAPFIAVEPEPQEDNLAGLIKRLHEVETAPTPAFQTRRALEAARPEDEEDLRRAEHRLHLLTPDPVPDLTAPRIAAGMVAITAPVLDVPNPLPDDAEAPGVTVRRLRGAGAGRAILGAIPDAAHGTLAQRKFRHAYALHPRLAAPAAAGRDTPARRVAPVAGRNRARPLIVLSALLILAMIAVALGSLVFSVDRETATPAVAPIPAAQDAPERAASGTSDAPIADVIAPSNSAESSDSAPGVAPAGVTPAPPTETAAGPAGAPESATDAAVAAALGDPAAEGTATAEAPPPEVSAPRDVPLTAPAALPQPEADAPGAPAISEAATGSGDIAGPAALPAAAGAVADAPPEPQPLPPPFGTVVTFGPNGLIVPTPEGVITPGGFTLFAGKPPVLPPPRPGSAAPATAPAADVAPPDAAGTVAPATAAPDDGATAPEAAPALAPATALALAGPKPRARPESVVAAAAQVRLKAEALAEAAAAAARAEAERIATATPQAVASSRRPARRPNRPSGFATAVDAAVADAVASAVTAPAAEPAAAPRPAPAVVAANPAPTPEPPAAEEIDEPEPVALVPNRSTSVTVARQATVKNALNLSEISLIGVYGSAASRRALIRMPTGRFIKVKVGDRFDGGTVAAIGDSEVSYVKRGKTILLKMVKKG